MYNQFDAPVRTVMVSNAAISSFKIFGAHGHNKAEQSGVDHSFKTKYPPPVCPLLVHNTTFFHPVQSITR